jgi:hypothetical protein
MMAELAKHPLIDPGLGRMKMLFAWPSRDAWMRQADRDSNLAPDLGQFENGFFPTES